MKKLENFSNCLGVLKTADFELAGSNEIYRTGVIGQFNLTFELAWKALQAVLRLHGAMEASSGSPRDILQIGYKYGFVDDAPVWLLMLKKRNLSVHVYNEDDAAEMLLLIRDSFIPAFVALEQTLKKKWKTLMTNRCETGRGMAVGIAGDRISTYLNDVKNVKTARSSAWRTARFLVCCCVMEMRPSLLQAE